jgi:copper(I)-binding protein
VNLASGGYHVMLFDLQRQLKEGEQVPLTLVVQDAAGKRENVALSVPVKPLTYKPAGAAAH